MRVLFVAASQHVGWKRTGAQGVNDNLSFFETNGNLTKKDGTERPREKEEKKQHGKLVDATELLLCLQSVTPAELETLCVARP